MKNTKTTKTTKNVICYSQSNQGKWCQEYYDTFSGDARKRVKILRKEGYEVTADYMGKQITHIGGVKMTRLTILPGTNNDTMSIPPVIIEQIIVKKNILNQFN